MLFFKEPVFAPVMRLNMPRLFSRKFKTLTLLSTAAAVLVVAGAGPVYAQFQGSRFDILGIFDQAPLMEQAMLAALSDPGFSSKILDPAALRMFYDGQNYKPVWVQAGGLNKNADVFTGWIETAWQHGLNSETYHFSQIRTLAAQNTPEARARLELVIADGFIRYARDLSGMRVDPVSAGVDAERWKQPLSIEESWKIMVSGKDMDAIKTQIEPPSTTYKLLQKELIRLTQEPDEPYKDVLPIGFGPQLIKPAMRHEKIPALRLRLAEQPQTLDPLLYDDRLAAAVMKFQREHGLKDDGIVGTNTLRALNRNKRDRMLQVVANLERLRWLDYNRPPKYVVVNIPSATLWAIENGSVVFEMPVIVGKPKRATPSFIAEIKGVRFNPSWTVPPTIKRDDIWPKLQEDPYYLVDKGIELYEGYGPDAPTLDPLAIDWASLTPNDLHRLRMVQVPGDHNPLGHIRVIMPNKYNVYLHDTNERSRFEGVERALSSGCVRMHDPGRMAEFIMKEKGWDAARIERTVAVPKTRDYLVDQPIPIYLLYYTVWVNSDGGIVYGSDVYDLDKKLIDVLAKVDGVAIPGHNDLMANSGRSEFALAQ